MAITIVIDGDSGLLTDGVKCIAETYGWTETIKDAEGNDITNPQTALDKSKLVVGDFLKGIIASRKATLAAEAARTATLDAANSALATATIEVTEG